MYVGQVKAIVDKYGCRIPPSFDGPAEQAVLEASLMHLRLLDEFLRNGGRGAFKASDWIPGWAPRPWLRSEVRRRLSAQVAHLLPHRELHYEWDFCAYGARLLRRARSLLRRGEEALWPCAPRGVRHRPASRCRRCEDVRGRARGTNL